MSDPVNFQSYRNKAKPPQLTPEEKQFDAIVFALQDMPLRTFIEALFASRDAGDFIEIIDELASFINHYGPGPARIQPPPPMPGSNRPARCRSKARSRGVAFSSGAAAENGLVLVHAMAAMTVSASTRKNRFLIAVAARAAA
jgi:hypothetical protein